MGFRTRVGKVRYLGVDEWHYVVHEEIISQCRNKVHPMMCDNNMKNNTWHIDFVKKLHADIVSNSSWTFNKVLNPIIWL